MSDVKVAIHQPNFIPWFPYFYKMALADVFIIYTHVLFTKNGFQNRCQINEKWWTKPVHQKTEAIHLKDYVGLETEHHASWTQKGGSLHQLNYQWIEAIKDTLDIKTKLVYEAPKLSEEQFPPHVEQDPTQHLIDLIKANKGTVYITNPDAKDKYLNEELIQSSGIKIEYCKVPKNLQRHTFEIFHEYGIEGAIKQLPRRKV